MDRNSNIKIKIPKNHVREVSWYREDSDFNDLISIITYSVIEKKYYLWRVLDDGKLEKMKTKKIPDFSVDEMNGKK